MLSHKGGENKLELDFENDSVDEEMNQDANVDKASNLLSKTSIVNEEVVDDEKEEGEADDEEDEGEVTSLKDEGQVETDEELEEGEVKDDKICFEEAPKPEIHPTSGHAAGNKTICRHFAKGSCTWGSNCRFVHVSNLPDTYKPGDRLDLSSSVPVIRPPYNARLAEEESFQNSTPSNVSKHVQPPSSSSSTAKPQAGNTESAWERGLKQAKEMIVKAIKRKEEEVDFDEKRFNIGVVDDHYNYNSYHRRESADSYHRSPSKSRSPNYRSPREKERDRDRERDHRTRDRPIRDREIREREVRDSRDPRERESREIREPRGEIREPREREPRESRGGGGGGGDPRDRERRHDRFSTSDYERRRRLAYEAAPWNDDPCPPSSSRERPLKSSSSSHRPRDNAESFCDPWRRSKSPFSKRTPDDIPIKSCSRPRSVSSVSGSDSASDLTSNSGTFTSSDSFVTENSAISPNGPRSKHRSNVSDKKPPSRQVESSHAIRNRIPKLPSARDRTRDMIPTKRPPAQATQKRRDSWDETDSDSSTGSGSSVSGSSSGSDSEGFSMSGDDRRRGGRGIGSSSGGGGNTSRTLKSNRNSSSQGIGSSRGSSNVKSHRVSSPHDPNTMKRQKTGHHSSSMNRTGESRSNKSRGMSPMRSPGNYSPPARKKSMQSPVINEPSQKKPISMTFMKKHENLKKDHNVTAKLNDGRDGSDDDIDCGDRLTPPIPVDSSHIRDKITSDELSKSSLSKSTNSSSAFYRGQPEHMPSKREELVKKLRQVEAAIAKKKAKAH